jgi:hypothetical protein
VTFPLSDTIGDRVQAQLVADATTGQVAWVRGEIVYDDPLQVPITNSIGTMVPEGFVLVHETRMTPKYMGGVNAVGQNLSSYLGLVPVQVTLVARDQGRDTQVARRQVEDMMTNVCRVLCGGDVTLASAGVPLVMHIDNVSIRTDGIPKQGVAWATILVEYRFIASPI